MKQEIQGLRGEIELLVHKMEKSAKEQEDRYSEIEQRLNQLSEKPPSTNPTTQEGTAGNTEAVDIETLLKEIEGGKEGESTSGTTETTTTNVATATTENASADEEPAYQQAFKWVHQGQYEQVITAFKEFLTHYPQGKHAADAQYWIGESQYALKKFDDALVTYRQLMEKYPQSSKYSYAQLKIGYIYAEKQDYTNARTTLNKVKSDFAGTAVARLAEERLRKLQPEETH